jgi:DNA-binding transcriptional ArsR family regulator
MAPVKKPLHSCRTEEHVHRGPPKPACGAAELERAARLFRALGDGPRLLLLQLLAGGERCVTELVEAAGEKFSTVSQRLRVLRGEGLVTRRRAGTHLYYALADQHVTDLMANALAHAHELGAGPAPLSKKRQPQHKEQVS